MSTFDGIIEEFPDIRIDFFRPSATDSKPALAYFVSHVHSDHLVGLESCKSSFIYCSPATRDILLRLEKYPHRMNFAKGILETRKQTYRHLKNLLKAIPLETPTVIELCPSKEIRVTLFDANHCVGAVMFLIEGSGNAVLYTGDIRSELWWVNSLTRQPLLQPYVCPKSSKPLQTLDTIYLDTTFVVTGKDDPYVEFPSKAEGLQELLQKVSHYPRDTLFYLDAWTFGYEDVWEALSSFLGSRIHVDDYRYKLHRALANGPDPKATDAAKFMGYYCGNHFQQGCLSTQGPECRIHSCEKGTGCEIWTKDFIRITPIVSRHHGKAIAELGAGGGQGDLDQHELEVFDAASVGQLMALCAAKLDEQPQLFSNLIKTLASAMKAGAESIKLDDINTDTNPGNEAAEADVPLDLEGMPLEEFVTVLAKLVTRKRRDAEWADSNLSRESTKKDVRMDGLPKHINFPYSRHSSYSELCELIAAFKPKNIHACTTDLTNWSLRRSMSVLFGPLYDSPQSFRHDEAIVKKKANGLSNRVVDSSKHPLVWNSSGENVMGTRTSISNTGPPFKGAISSANTQSKCVRSEHMCLDNLNYSSPPHGSLRPRSLNEASLDLIEVHGQATTAPVNRLTRDRSQESRHERNEKTTPPMLQLQKDGVLQRENQCQPLHFGRLSSAGTSKKHMRDINDDANYMGRSNSRRRTCKEKTSIQASDCDSAKSPESSPLAQSRLAFRQDVYDAIVGGNSAFWSEISLVSVHGHHAKEQEL